MAVRLRSISIGQIKHECKNSSYVSKYITNSRIVSKRLNCFPVRRVGCVDGLDEGLRGVGQVRDHEADEEEYDLLLKQNRRARKPDVILGTLNIEGCSLGNAMQRYFSDKLWSALAQSRPAIHFTEDRFGVEYIELSERKAP